jgi:hypothetical protein
MGLKGNRVWECGMDWSGSGLGPVTGCCEPLCFIQAENFTQLCGTITNCAAVCAGNRKTDARCWDAQ